MTPRITIVFAILAFAVVNIAGMFQGRDLIEVWLTSLVAMVGFAVVGFCLGMLYDRLIKEILMQEDALMFSNYLDENPVAGGRNSKNGAPVSAEDDESSENEEAAEGGDEGSEEAA